MSTKLVQGAVADYYDALAQEGFTAEIRDPNIFEVGDGGGRLQLRGYLDIRLIDLRSGRPLAPYVNANEPGGDAALEAMGTFKWHEQSRAARAEKLQPDVKAYYSALGSPENKIDLSIFMKDHDGYLQLRGYPDIRLINSRGQPRPITAISHDRGGRAALKATGLSSEIKVSAKEEKALREVKKELGEREAVITRQPTDEQGLLETEKGISAAVQTIERELTEVGVNTDLAGDDLKYPVREILGYAKSLETYRGVLADHNARISATGKVG